MATTKLPSFNGLLPHLADDLRLPSAPLRPRPHPHLFPLTIKAAETLAKGEIETFLIERKMDNCKPCGGAIPLCMVGEFDLPFDIIDRRVTKMKMISPSNVAVDIGRTLKPHEYIGMVRREVLDAYLRDRGLQGYPPSISPARLSFVPNHPTARPVPTCGGAVRVFASSRAKPRVESPKVRNRRLRRKFNGTSSKPRLSVFCSEKQLYAMLIDDHNKKTLFYASTLQKFIREDPPCDTIEAARRVGEELVKVCATLNISEISKYDRNGFSRGEKMQAFELPIRQHGFLHR